MKSILFFSFSFSFVNFSKSISLCTTFRTLLKIYAKVSDIYKSSRFLWSSSGSVNLLLRTYIVFESVICEKKSWTLWKWDGNIKQISVRIAESITRWIYFPGFSGMLVTLHQHSKFFLINNSTRCPVTAYVTRFSALNPTAGARVIHKGWLMKEENSLREIAQMSLTRRDVNKDTVVR